MKNREILSLYEGINEIKAEEFEVKVSFAFAKNIIILEPYYKAIKQAQKTLWIKYGEANGEGDLVVPKDKIEELEKENGSLMKIENNLEVEKITLKDIEKNRLSIDNLLKIMPMINEKPQE